MQNNSSLAKENNLLNKRIIDFGPTDIHKEYLKKMILKTSTGLSFVLDDIDIHIWILGDTHTYLYVNQEHANFAGKDILKCTGHTIKEVFDSESSSIIIEKNRQVFEKKIPISTTLKIKDKYGAYRILQVKLAPKLDISDQVVYVVGIAWDITHSYTKNQRILENELLYRSIVEDDPAYILRFSHEGDIRFANSAALNFFNKNFEDLVGASLLDYVPHCLHDMFYEQINRFTIYNPIHCNTRCFQLGDEYYWVVFRDVASFDDQGQVKEIQAVAYSNETCNYSLSHGQIYDQITRCINKQHSYINSYNNQLTELTNANVSLTKRNAEMAHTLRLLIELIQYPLIIMDNTSKIVVANHSFKNLVKYSDIELAEKKNFLDFINDRVLIDTINSVVSVPNELTVIHYPYEFSILDKYGVENLCYDLNLTNITDNRILMLIHYNDVQVSKEVIPRSQEIIQHIVRLSTTIDDRNGFF